MLVCVAFEYVERCVRVSVDVGLETLTCAVLTGGSAGKEISEEEGVMFLTPSSTNVADRFEQLSMSMQT
jgi:hypothetical protein